MELWCFDCCWAQQTLKQTIKLLVIVDAMLLMWWWHHCNNSEVMKVLNVLQAWHVPHKKSEGSGPPLIAWLLACLSLNVFKLSKLKTIWHMWGNYLVFLVGILGAEVLVLHWDGTLTILMKVTSLTKSEVIRRWSRWQKCCQNALFILVSHVIMVAQSGFIITCPV